MYENPYLPGYAIKRTKIAAFYMAIYPYIQQVFITIVTGGDSFHNGTSMCYSAYCKVAYCPIVLKISIVLVIVVSGLIASSQSDFSHAIKCSLCFMVTSDDWLFVDVPGAYAGQIYLWPAG